MQDANPFSSSSSTCSCLLQQRLSLVITVFADLLVFPAQRQSTTDMMPDIVILLFVRPPTFWVGPTSPSSDKSTSDSSEGNTIVLIL
jgi:hypothetical protein